MSYDYAMAVQLYKLPSSRHRRDMGSDVENDAKLQQNNQTLSKGQAKVKCCSMNTIRSFENGAGVAQR